MEQTTVSMEQYLINKYLGVPYKHKGRLMDGLDCYGLIIMVYGEWGFSLFDVEEYDVNWCYRGRNLILENYYKQWDKVDRAELFDVVMFKGKYGVNHGGVTLKDERFIHCCRQGTVVSRLWESPWKERLAGFYHLRAK